MTITMAMLLVACTPLSQRPSAAVSAPAERVASTTENTPASGSVPETSTPAASSLATVPEPRSLPRRPSRGARLDSALLTETSGLAVSRRDPAILWAINDSGHAAVLHALSRHGERLGEWSVPVPNRDWEDLATLVMDNEPWLLIADTGDNRRRYGEYALHLVREPPLPLSETTPAAHTLDVARTVRFRYEDGSHDVEAVGVDASTLTAWLLVKSAPVDGIASAGGVYTLSLAADADTPGETEALRVARRVTTLAEPKRSIEGRFAIALAGVDLEQPTAFDIAEDNTSACLLTYRKVRCYRRVDGEDWSETLSRPGISLRRHGLEQAEALALSTDGLLWTTSEGQGAPLLTLPWATRSGSGATR